MARELITVLPLSRDRVKNMPQKIRRTFTRFMDEAAGEVEATFRENAPRKTGNLRDHIAAVPEGDAITVTVPGVPYAKARNAGAFIEPKNGRALRFETDDGDVVYAAWVRQTGTGWFDRGILESRDVVEEAFHERFEAGLR